MNPPSEGAEKPLMLLLEMLLASLLATSSIPEPSK